MYFCNLYFESLLPTILVYFSILCDAHVIDRPESSKQTWEPTNHRHNKRAIPFTFGEAPGATSADFNGGCNTIQQGIINQGFIDAAALATNAAANILSTNTNAQNLKNALFGALADNIIQNGFTMLASPPLSVTVWCGVNAIPNLATDTLNQIVELQEEDGDPLPQEEIDQATTAIQQQFMTFMVEGCAPQGTRHPAAFSFTYTDANLGFMNEFLPTGSMIVFCDTPLPPSGTGTGVFQSFANIVVRTGGNLDQFETSMGLTILHELTHAVDVGINVNQEACPTQDFGNNINECRLVVGGGNPLNGDTNAFGGLAITPQNNAASWEWFAAGVANIGVGPNLLAIAWVDAAGNVLPAP